MAATASLDDTTFRVPPPVAASECASQVKQQEQFLSQPGHHPAVSEEQPLTLGRPTTNEPIWIPSDTESRSDLDDTDADDGCQGLAWHSDDTLLSTDALMPSTTPPDDACYIDTFGREPDNLANNMHQLDAPTNNRLSQEDAVESLHALPSLSTENETTQNPATTNTDCDLEIVGNTAVVASDGTGEGLRAHPPSLNGLEEDDFQEARGRAPSTCQERTRTHQRSISNFNINANTRPRSNGDDNDTQEHQEGLEHGIPSRLSTLSPGGGGKVNDSPDVDQHLRKRRKIEESTARGDSPYREVPRDPLNLTTASDPKTTLATSSSYDSVMRHDQEYSPTARDGDVTKASSESCDTDDSDYDARKRRRPRRSSARRKPDHQLHAASPSSRWPVLYCSHGEGDPRAPSATFKEWRLDNANLKRVFMDGQAIFQIQFGWDPCSNSHSAADSNSGSELRSSTAKRSRQAPRSAIGIAFTPEEDDLLIDLKERHNGLTWSRIHRQFSNAFPGRRTKGSLQVHYCKLKGRKETESPVVLQHEDEPAGRPRRSSRKTQYPYEVDSDCLDESDDGTEDGNCFPVERVLARAENDDFLVLWSDGTTTWEPRSHFQDQKLLEEFENFYCGYDDGVDVLDSRTVSGVRQYLLHWQGRPADEDSWVSEELISRDRIDNERRKGEAYKEGIRSG